MALTGLTEVQFTNLNVTGVATFAQNVGIAGTLTYEDVTNIDSVGVITARSDLSIADKIIHSGDTNTAIRFPIADRITAEVAGGEKVRISSIGVGINTDIALYNTTNSHLVVRGNNTASSSDQAVAVLHSGTAGIGQLRFTDGATGHHASQSWVQYNHNTTKFTIGWNAQGRVHGGPNNELGLYYDSPSNLDSNAHELVIGGGTGSGGMTFFNSTSGQGNIFFADGIGSAADKKRGRIIYDHSANDMAFFTVGSERMTIASDGVISGDFNDTSDIALKENISEISSSYEKVKQLNPVTFNWKEEQEKGTDEQIGFIAQEVEKVYPELVEGEEGNKSVNVIGLVSVLTKTVQELTQKVEELEKKSQ